VIEGMDSVGIVVDDLDAGVAFFTEPGLELEGEARSSASCSDAYKSAVAVAERAMVVSPIGNADATPVRRPRTGGPRGQAHQ
jgi:catechol 2,3-dioxygenase-like lactoylglutathione lyase family enzyme